MAEGSESALREALETICSESLVLRPGESLLLVADPPGEGLARKMESLASGLGHRCRLARIGEVTRAGAAPPEFTRDLLTSADAVLLVTSRSLSHTEERRYACYEAGVRIASLPGLTEDMLLRLFPRGSIGRIVERCASLSATIEGAGQLRVRTGRGTDLSFPVSGGRVYQDTGLYDEPGRFGNLPAGEVSLAPHEESSQGRLVVDVAFAGLGAVMDLDLRIEAGRIVSAEGPGSRELLELLADGSDRVLGEFGIGTNPLARTGPLTLEAEKAVGTVHFGFGDNRSFGGHNAASGHWDAVLRCGSIEVDGRRVELEN